MKRLLVALAVLIVLGAMFAPVASAKAVRFKASGTLNSADTATGVLSVHVKHGSRVLVPYFGTDVNFQTSADTKFNLCVKGTQSCSKITIADLLAGDKLSLAGVIRTDGTFAALSVTAVR
ncbi:MAG: hypothetical protein HY741_14405 [Chloroflexi bacterium]|nr:hypothetical protein [Chloroflexota bacterium]